MNGRSIPAELGSRSFACPSCNANAHQSWFKIFLSAHSKDGGPWVPNAESLESIRKDAPSASVVTFFENLASRKLFIERHENTSYLQTELLNLSVSQCYSCDAYAVWIAEALLYPIREGAIEPAEDMPEDVLRDFNEAAGIVGKSPRGAAALLRLCIQKLMVELGQRGQNLSDDIGKLVKSGLDPRVQEAADVVRVVGNNAVHPGTIDLRDDKATALKLFDLVNVIVVATISVPKRIKDMYQEILPETARAQIKKRDKKDSNEA